MAQWIVLVCTFHFENACKTAEQHSTCLTSQNSEDRDLGVIDQSRPIGKLQKFRETKVDGTWGMTPENDLWSVCMSVHMHNYKTHAYIIIFNMDTHFVSFSRNLELFHTIGTNEVYALTELTVQWDWSHSPKEWDILWNMYSLLLGGASTKSTGLL